MAIPLGGLSSNPDLLSLNPFTLSTSIPSTQFSYKSHNDNSTGEKQTKTYGLQEPTAPGRLSFLSTSANIKRSSTEFENVSTRASRLKFPSSTIHRHLTKQRIREMKSSLSWYMQDAPNMLYPSSLRETASWIRDVLDPIIARDGPNELQPDDVLTIHNLLIALRQYTVPLSAIRFSRIHLAVAEICGKATRWPSKLADEADLVLEHLQMQHGPLKYVMPPLFERGGRLWKICDQTEVTRPALYKRFKADNSSFVDNSRAYSTGSLDFHAGNWWINSMFAFRDGIIDNKCVNGGICCDENGAYALVLTGGHEINAETPNSFTYRCKRNDPGIFRLAMCHPRTKSGIRVLRSHALSSLWAPVAGIRYDGLYKVVGWSWSPKAKEQLPPEQLAIDFQIHFERVDESPYEVVLRRPLADELDDYRAYKLAVRDHQESHKVRDRALSLGNAAVSLVDVHNDIVTAPRDRVGLKIYDDGETSDISREDTHTWTPKHRDSLQPTEIGSDTNPSGEPNPEIQVHFDVAKELMETGDNALSLSGRTIVAEHPYHESKKLDSWIAKPTFRVIEWR